MLKQPTKYRIEINVNKKTEEWFETSLFNAGRI